MSENHIDTGNRQSDEGEDHRDQRHPPHNHHHDSAHHNHPEDDHSTQNHYAHHHLLPLAQDLAEAKEEDIEASDDDIEHDFDTLPILAYKQDILQALRTQQIVIIIGETGSGKTTQMPQFFLENQEEFLPSKTCMAITQPRRIAAMSIATRVAEECQVNLGQEVGYSVRFDDRTSFPTTKLKYMTDGILIRECLYDPMLSQYKVIMLDEAHERSLNTDILFALIKKACKQRPDLKVIITSATLDAKKFQEYFFHCPILHIPGRLYPVDIYHSKTAQIITQSGANMSAYVNSAVDIAMKIHLREDDGHILIFMTGQEDIEKTCAALQQRLLDDLQHTRDRIMIVLPLYAALTNDEQIKIFQKPQLLYDDVYFGRGGKKSHSRGGRDSRMPSSYQWGKALTDSTVTLPHPKDVVLFRKCVIATNIAETSITVPHVKFVIDAGLIKQKCYDPNRGMESLVTVPIAQMNAGQRAGRAGRTGPGQCYRLYTKEDFTNVMLHACIPEIQRTNLANTVLYLKAIGISNIVQFDFLDPPSTEQLLQALHVLHLLQGIDHDGIITELGRQMSAYPLDPYLSRMLISASESEHDCVEEMVMICAMLSVENVFRKPKSRNFQHNAVPAIRGGGGEASSSSQQYQQQRQQRIQQQVQRSVEEERCDIAHAGLRHSYGDFHTLWQVFKKWEESGGYSASWCDQNFINYRSMKTAKSIREHLLQDVKKQGLLSDSRKYSGSKPSFSSTGSGKHGKDGSDNKEKSLDKRISYAMTSAYFMQCAARCGNNDSIYKCLPIAGVSNSSEVRMVHIHPQSAMAQMEGSECVYYQELVHQGGKLYMRNVGKASRRSVEACMAGYKYITPHMLSGDVDLKSKAPTTAHSHSKRSSDDHRRDAGHEENNDRKRLKVEEVSSDSSKPMAAGNANKASMPASNPPPPATNTGSNPPPAPSAALSAVEQAKLRYLNRKAGGK